MPQHLFLPNASWPRPNGSTAQAPAIDLPNLREIWTHWHAIERAFASPGFGARMRRFCFIERPIWSETGINLGALWVLRGRVEISLGQFDRIKIACVNLATISAADKNRQSPI